MTLQNVLSPQNIGSYFTKLSEDCCPFSFVFSFSVSFGYSLSVAIILVNREQTVWWWDYSVVLVQATFSCYHLQVLPLLLLANMSLAIYACCCFSPCTVFVSSAFMHVYFYSYFIHTYLNISVTNLYILTKLYLYLGMTKFILGVINGNGYKELLRSFLAIHELSLWDSTCIQHPVSVGKNRM